MMMILMRKILIPNYDDDPDDDPDEDDPDDDDPGEGDCVKAGARAGFHSTEAPCGALSASTHLLLQSLSSSSLLTSSLASSSSL